MLNNITWGIVFGFPLFLVAVLALENHYRKKDRLEKEAKEAQAATPAQ